MSLGKEIGAVTAAETELEKIVNQLNDLNSHANDINRRITQFNDRVQGVIPREEPASGNTKSDDSLLNGIGETIGYLQAALNALDEEVSRLNSIG